MRGLYSSKTEIRHKIFTEIARMAYEGQSPEMLEELPYKIVPGEIATYRDSIFLERAVVGETSRCNGDVTEKGYRACANLQRCGGQRY